ncbi:MAG: DNA replication/repair protein RecF [Gammaproteobacteria bacterium]|nr:DNA replication/repair protein RecF [Gammaproteobacteria bacterium]
MGLQSLSIRRFRCFASADLDLSSRLNVILGKNASGKTSILEAFYLLSRGRSFRTAHLDAAVQQGSAGFLLAARTISQRFPMEISLARQDGVLEAKIGGKAVKGLSQLAAVFPVQLLDGQANQLINGGPKYRRQFLDWGTFHVEQRFYQTWYGYCQALRQRNILLKANRPKAEVAVWDVELAKHGEELSEIRQRYLQNLCPHALKSAEQSLDGVPVSIEYRRGWPVGMRLAEALQIWAKKDRMLGVTHTGPHRADLAIRVNGRPAQEAISRGQEKVLAAAFLLAQADFYQRESRLSCTLLVDDLAAELDADHLRRLLQRISEVGAQVIMTAIESLPALNETAGAVFHVKQGNCHRMV